MTHGSLFSGIGGFDLAAEWMGWTNVFNCEWEEFPRQVLKHHFPNAQQYADIREFDATTYARRIDIISGGFPCQPYSVAGERKGSDDERHLWPEMLRVIRECSPRWVVGENVRGLASWNGGMVFEEVCTDLEAIGYEVQPFVLPAASVGAPHKRERIWFVAYADDKGRRTGYGKVPSSNGEVPERNDSTQLSYTNSGDVAHANTGQRKQSQKEVRSGGNALNACNQSNATDTLSTTGESKRIGRQGERKFERCSSTGVPDRWSNFPTVAPVCGGDDGIPKRLDGITFPKWRRESIKAYGNAIVPQVAHQIFKAIYLYEQGCK
jgi:DNA (cytosine-5)-methyltransferase 1